MRRSPFGSTTATVTSATPSAFRSGVFPVYSRVASASRKPCLDVYGCMCLCDELHFCYPEDICVPWTAYLRSSSATSFCRMCQGGSRARPLMKYGHRPGISSTTSTQRRQRVTGGNAVWPKAFAHT
jgi:hypothetical protein